MAVKPTSPYIIASTVAIAAEIARKHNLPTGSRLRAIMDPIELKGLRPGTKILVHDKACDMVGKATYAAFLERLQYGGFKLTYVSL